MNWINLRWTAQAILGYMHQLAEGVLGVNAPLFVINQLLIGYMEIIFFPMMSIVIQCSFKIVPTCKDFLAISVA